MKNYILIAFLIMNSCTNLIGQGKEAIHRKSLEKICLQTDRDIYITGEEIWFRADYKTVGDFSQNELSKSVYVELVTPLGESVNKQKYAIIDGVATGEYSVPEGLLTATYMLRVYTQFQRNYPKEHITTNLILVINPSIPLTGYEDKLSWKLKIYPDWLKNGKKEKVKMAIRVHPKMIKDVKKLVVSDQFENIVSEVKIHKNGLNLVEFPTNDSLRYSAMAILTSGDTIREDIPKSKTNTSLTSEIAGVLLKLKFMAPEVTLDNSYTIDIYDGYLVQLQTEEVKANIGWQEFKLGKSILDANLIYFVIKNSDHAVMHVDAIYQPGDKIRHIDVEVSKKKYSTRSDVDVSFKHIDDQTANYTISVVKKGTYENKRFLLPEFIMANPQLLPSFIKQRFVYNDDFKNQLEALLFVYEDVLISDPSLFKDSHNVEAEKYWIPETRGVTIRGVVRHINSHKPEPASDVYVAAIGNKPQLHVYKTNDNGEFIFTLKHVSGIQNLFLCVDSENENSLEILVNSDFVNNYEAFYETPTILDTSLRKFIQDLYVNAQLEVYKEMSDTLQVLTNKYDPIRFPEPSAAILLDDYIALPTMREVINEIVPFVKVQKKKEVFSLEVFDPVTNQLYGDPLILIDNLPVFNVNELIEINPELIKRIAVINSTYVYGEHLFRGIVFLETNTNNFAGIELPVSSTFLEFQSVDNVTVFTSDSLNDASNESKRIPDFRNVLYWNHDVQLNNGQGLCTFSTSDYKGTYEVVVRGVSEDGIVSIGTTSFEVEE